jgi:hypothetical protein
MSTDLKSNTRDVSLTRFWGGQRGTCVQVTQRTDRTKTEVDQFFDNVQLTREQAAQLALDLLDFAASREQEDV